MTMSMAAKAAWPILWTECDDHGLFEWKPIVLKARIFPADNLDFSTVLSEYEALGCVRRVEISGRSFGLVRNFGKFQRPKNPSYRFPWVEALSEFAGFNSVDSGSPTPALPQPSPTNTEIPSQMKEEGGKREEGKKENGPKQVRTAYPEDFEKFWDACSAWRGHSGKKEALDAWRKLSSEDREAAMAGVPGYSASLRVPNAPSALHVCRFLKYRRFEVYAGSVVPFSGADPPRRPMTDAEELAASRKFDEDWRAGKYA